MKTAKILEHEEFDKFLNAILEMFGREIAKLKSDIPERPMTKKQAAKYFSCSVGTFDKKFKNNKLPAKFRHYNGGTPYFFASELEAFLKKS